MTLTPKAMPPAGKGRPRKRRRRRELQPALDALLGALGKAGLTDQSRRLQIMAAWSTAVGARIAARTEPHVFSRGVLTIKVQTTAWQNELTFLKRDLVNRLNQVLGAHVVKELKMVGGTVHKRRSPERVELPPLPSAQARRVADTAASIEDDEVRARFVALMEKELRRRQM
jgi:hypothetical protein